jgi:hypothetical protein
MSRSNLSLKTRSQEARGAYFGAIMALYPIQLPLHMLPHFEVFFGELASLCGRAILAKAQKATFRYGDLSGAISIHGDESTEW